MSAELKQKIQDIRDRLLALKEHLELSDKEEKLKRLEAATRQPGFWNKIDEAKKINQEISRIKETLENWNSFHSHLEDSETLLELALEEDDPNTVKEAETAINNLEKQLSSFELNCMFTGEHDANNAILAINAGAGGTEAQDWVEILMRMYLRWSENKGFKTDILDYLPGDEAGIKGVTIMVKGHNGYGHLRSEIGIHRLVRISPFDAGGRRHTSFASVFVFPELDDSIKVDINEKDLRIDTYRASGAGGQHVNKTSSAIRITHIPTNIVVQCQNERSQHRNKDMALKMLKARLYEKEREVQQEQHQELKGEKKNIAWGSQIRSYIMQPYQLIKDHRTNFETGKVDHVLNGDLDPFIKEYLLWQS
ncbi:MAG: peptide chain release factor 2 [Thermodesulfobacteriota bacterium]